DVTADAIDTDIANNRFSNVAITEDGGILLEVTNNSSGAVEKIIVADAITDAGYSKDFVVNGVVAQVGDNVVNVDKFVNFYLANGVNATAHVDSSVDGELSIWLSDSLEDRGKQFEGDFTVIDATNSNAVKSELAGNDNDNTILAGNSGATSLWGGNGGNDLLVGGNGVDSFFYGLGNGDDTITGVSDGDAIILANITLDQISDRNITDNSVVLKFNDGGQLTVNDGGTAVNFTVGDQTFRVNNERNDFVTAR
ncbi:MAG: hypothetical protein J5497_01065, partial [Selenomonadaceae bacterium]|nr:hypothetical protein [Selenomonadaceae bacterium]